MEKYLLNKNLNPDLIEYIYCLININLNRSEIFVKEILNSYILQNQKNLDLFNQLCPKAQVLFITRSINSRLHYIKSNKAIANKIKDFITYTITENKNKSFDEQLYIKLKEIEKNLPKTEASLISKVEVNSLINLIEKKSLASIKDLNEQISNFEIDLTQIIKEMNIEVEQTIEKNINLSTIEQITAREEEIKNFTEIIKKLIISYYDKFGAIFIYKAIDNIEDKINQLNLIPPVQDAVYNTVIKNIKDLIQQK